MILSKVRSILLLLGGRSDSCSKTDDFLLTPISSCSSPYQISGVISPSRSTDATLGESRRPRRVRTMLAASFVIAVKALAREIHASECPILCSAPTSRTEDSEVQKHSWNHLVLLKYLGLAVCISGPPHDEASPVGMTVSPSCCRCSYQPNHDSASAKFTDSSWRTFGRYLDKSKPSPLTAIPGSFEGWRCVRWRWRWLIVLRCVFANGSLLYG